MFLESWYLLKVILKLFKLTNISVNLGLELIKIKNKKLNKEINYKLKIYKAYLPNGT